MVHYLEVTTTAALLAILCPFMVMAQEVFQAEVINLFFHYYEKMSSLHHVQVLH